MTTPRPPLSAASRRALGLTAEATDAEEDARLAALAAARGLPTDAIRGAFEEVDRAIEEHLAGVTRANALLGEPQDVAAAVALLEAGLVELRDGGRLPRA